jgi:hypothetical protein
MFNILEYNIYFAFTFFTVIFIFLYLTFKNKIIAIIDPLVMHLLWISAFISFLLVFLFKHGLNEFLIIFFFAILGYTFLLSKFLIPIKKRKSNFTYDRINISSTKLLCIYSIIIILYTYSQYNFLSYMITHSIPEWFLYRFIHLQGGEPLARIIRIGANPLFLYLSFLMIFILKKFKFTAWFFLIIYILIGMLSGGRSTLLQIAYSFGLFLFFYKDFFDSRIIKKINIYGTLSIGASIILAMFVTSMYSSDHTLKDGIFIILNRVMAAADGLAYYMLYNGFDNIDQGIYPYIMSIFGIYLKTPLGVEYKNIGHQLTELAAGIPLEFAQGSNYTLPLQVMVLGYYSLPMYVLFSAYLVSKLRNLTPQGSISKQIIIYFLISKSFFIVQDPEYGVLTILSFFTIYLIFIYPILKINFNSIKKDIRS